MDISIIKELSAFSNVGLGMLIFIVWYFEKKEREKTNDRSAEYMNRIVMIAETQKKMYEDNASLVNRTQQSIKDMYDIQMMFTQKLTELVETVRSNQYCPILRQQREKWSEV